MLTKRQNLLETIRGGKPDRFVNQFSAFKMAPGDPVNAAFPRPKKGETNKSGWGVTYIFPEHTPGPLPLHGDGYTVVKDVTKWRDTVSAPPLDYPEEAWAPFVEEFNKIDRGEYFAALKLNRGIFELVHELLGMENCLISFYTEPEAMHELIGYITEWKLKYAKLLCDHFHPEAVLQHDDWGSQISTFISPDMFNEFIAPPTKKIYQCFRDNGVELIIHHNDSYSATLVPSMIDMGIDIWQGCISSNNVPELVKKYGGQISFMGDLSNGILDREDHTPELIRSEVERACRENGKLYFIPSLTMGAPNSVYTEVYDAVTAEIDRMSREMF